ncbi:hypothetical protein [Lysobacter sp. F6437]|uniref:hypothetical protein n=1 Tax=Lysobacter sp. F6437 TaxID=3459296 RepID=UPI00403E00F5
MTVQANRGVARHCRVVGRNGGFSGVAGQRGSAIIEYSIVTFLAVIVLISQENQIAQLMDAIKEVYESFSFALSMTFPTPD